MPKDPTSRGRRIPGRATPEGTARYVARFAGAAAPGHFREREGLRASSIGIGTYLGGRDDQTDSLVTAAVVRSVRGGVNVVDTAINYRQERGERSAGAALARLVDSSEAARDEILVCTKGGFVPQPSPAEQWFKNEYVARRELGIRPEDLAEGCHSMHPAYLADQLERSLANLGLETVDVYYIHNPETELPEVGRKVFYERLAAAFEALEVAADRGKIASYGLATWKAFRMGPEASEHIDLARVKEMARQAAGGREDRFRWIELPLNLAMTEGLALPTQVLGARRLPAIPAAGELGLAVVASSAISQGRVLGKIDARASALLGDASLTGALRALQFARSAPGVLSALVGMKSPAHVEENLALVALPPLPEETVHTILAGGS